MKQDKNILIFNQENPAINAMKGLLRSEDYDIFETEAPLEAIRLIFKNGIDVILANQNLAGIDSQEFKELAERISPEVKVFLLPMPSDNECATKEHGEPQYCQMGIRDLAGFISNHIRTEKRLINDCAQLKDFYFSFASHILKIFSVNDKYFFNNAQLVAGLSKRIAERMKLEETLIDAIQMAALLRDLGKLGIQQTILNDTEKLDQVEMSIIQSHPLLTIQMLKHIGFPWDVEPIIKHHHEYYNGTGYPAGLKGRAIPLGSRIIGVADAYIAMTTDRPYRKALTAAEAIEAINKKAGTQFDPEVVEMFLSVISNEVAPDKNCVLVVTQDPSLPALLRFSLDSDKFAVLFETNTDHAAAVLQEQKIDLLIADAEIATADKMAFYSRLRQKKSATEAVPIIILLPSKGYSFEMSDPLVYFVTKPLDVDELSQKIFSLCRHELEQALPVAGNEEMKGVSGKLEDFSLSDIIQILNIGLKTARVNLTRRGEKGEIYTKGGAVFNATLGALSGQEAFFELMQWDSGFFNILHGRTIDEVNITMDTMNLMMEAFKAIDESRKSENDVMNQSAEPSEPPHKEIEKIAVSVSGAVMDRVVSPASGSFESEFLKNAQ